MVMDREVLAGGGDVEVHLDAAAARSGIILACPTILDGGARRIALCEELGLQRVHSVHVKDEEPAWDQGLPHISKHTFEFL